MVVPRPELREAIAELLRYLRPAARPAQPVFDTTPVNATSGGASSRNGLKPANGRSPANGAASTGILPASHVDVRVPRATEHA